MTSLAWCGCGSRGTTTKRREAERGRAERGQAARTKAERTKAERRPAETPQQAAKRHVDFLSDS